MPIEKIQITIQAGDAAAEKMVRLVTFVDEERELSREAVEKVKKILDDSFDETQVFILFWTCGQKCKPMSYAFIIYKVISVL